MKEFKAAQQSSSKILEKMLQYDIITFDVFDTLITRCTLEPSDVFLIVEIIAKYRKLTIRSFASDRKAAEQLAYQKYGESTNFLHIYDTLHSHFSYSEDECLTLKALEMEVELQLTIPRTAVKELLFNLLSAGKRIILCSDMYLSSSDIYKLLAQCGYPENLELWVSCEKKASKNTGKLWTQLFEYLPKNKKIIHIGDNEFADYRTLKLLGREAYLIDSGLTLFKKSNLYCYLSRYIKEDVESSLILGYLINKACFNSPFSDRTPKDDIVSIWGGFIFSCFMDFLVKNQDDSLLLFATREGYLLQPMYELHCNCLGVKPQCNTLFYSSRTATIAATITSEKDMKAAMQHPKYKGSLAQFTKHRMNYTLSAAKEFCDMEIILPDQQKKVFQMLKPYFPDIFKNSLKQKEAYQSYISSFRKNNTKLTIVDVGYNGTIQYAVSKILSEKVNGLYMFLNSGTSAQKNGCIAKGLASPDKEMHPVYDNLLFLEGIMQVPYGQLQKMEFYNGNLHPTFNSDANYSKQISNAQNCFCHFITWIATWKKELGDTFKFDFELAESIWICLLKYDYLPHDLLDNLWLADDYCGCPKWQYNTLKQEWQGQSSTTPLSFYLIKNVEILSAKYKFKNLIKKHIPSFAYDFASKVWIKLIK